MTRKIEKAQYRIHEHLDIGLKCTYAQRLQWLEEANQFVRMLERKKDYPTGKKGKE